MTPTNAIPAMSREQIRAVLQRNRGSIRVLAGELGVSHTAVSLWLADKSTSARIAAAAAKRAAELIDEEKKKSSAA